MAEAGHRQVAAVLRVQGDAAGRDAWCWRRISVSHGKASACLPVIELLHGYFGIATRTTTAARGARRSGDVADALDPALEDTLPYLFALLGIVEGDDPLAQMDGQIKRRRTLEAIKRIVLRESLNQPLIVIFEDLHWIDERDPGVARPARRLRSPMREVLLLVNYRPEYRHEWGSKTYYMQLRLDPLGRRERRGDAGGAARREAWSWSRSSG